MGDLSIRNLDDQAKSKLRVRAALNGRSMEAEARAILESSVLEGPAGDNLLTALAASASTSGGVDLTLPGRPRPPIY
jgi:plasmid stability protein